MVITIVIVIHSVIGGFSRVDLVWLAALTVLFQVSDYNQLSDYSQLSDYNQLSDYSQLSDYNYTVWSQLYRIASEK